MGIQERRPCNGQARGFLDCILLFLGGHDAQKTQTAFSDDVLVRPDGLAHVVERLWQTTSSEYYADHDKRGYARSWWHLDRRAVGRARFVDHQRLIRNLRGDA